MERRARAVGENGIAIELLAAGTRAPGWINDGYREYTKRLPREWQPEIREMPVARRNRGAVIERLKREEGERMLGAVRPGGRLVALDSGGKIWDSRQLAANMDRWMQEYAHIQFMIGGPDGLPPACLSRADDTWSLSRLTFPHFLVRVLVAEQLYRAWAIVAGHPYHK